MLAITLITATALADNKRHYIILAIKPALIMI